jgi:hypothetical protein
MTHLRRKKQIIIRTALHAWRQIRRMQLQA